MKIALLAGVLVLLFACGEGQKEVIPDDLMSREAFVDMMVDAQLVEALGKGKIIRTENPRERLAALYASTYEKHGIEDSTFKKTYNWYFSHPEEMQLVLDDVIAKLTQIQTELENSN